jgi:hypothetical protein
MTVNTMLYAPAEFTDYRLNATTLYAGDSLGIYPNGGAKRKPTDPLFI